MNYSSPRFANKVNPPFRFSDEIKSPFTSPQNHSAQGFTPFSYSSPKNNYTSPKKWNRGGKMRYFNISNASTNSSSSNGQMRYFNNSAASVNSSSSNGSPHKFNRNNREPYYYKNHRGSLDSVDISLYYDPTAMENPWAELEKVLEEQLAKEAMGSVETQNNPSK